MKAILRVRARYPGQGHFIVVLRSDGAPRLEARKRRFRERAIRLGIPVFDELSPAALALSALHGHEPFVKSRSSAPGPA
ncbi:MAG: hypothetical protein HYY78_14665 [Betaproteobacteria bacterium]|nr:hypothetical protein [Betaproteobacteria bacterium]